MRLKVIKKEEHFFNINIQGSVRFYLKYCTFQMLFPGFYLVICTSDLNSILGIHLAI